MNKYKEMYESICRLCLSYDRNKNKFCLLDINSEDGLSCYGKSVLNFANISLNNKDCLPSFMCLKCLKLLKQAIYFKLRCEKSQKQLLRWIENYKKNDTIGSTIQEVIVQNIMYSYYFPEEYRGKCNSVSKTDYTTKECCQIDKEYINTGSSITEDNNENSDGCNNEDTDNELFNIMEKNISENSYIPLNSNKIMLQRKRIYRNQNNVASRIILKQKGYNRKKVTYKLSNGTDKAKFFCNICNKDLANQNTYRNHMQRHTGFKYICEHCGKGFPVLAELQLHQVAIHGTGRFLECEHCTFKAPNKHILVEHVRLHTGERPYTCDKCGLTFRRRAIWRKHMIYHTEKTVQCQQCPRKFYRRSEMLAHMNNMHERLYVYLCHKCDATYAKTSSVRRHLTERHGVPREMQGKIVRVNKIKAAGIL